MRFAYLTWAALAAVLFAVPATAGPCQTPICNTPAVVAPVVAVTPTVVLPLYGAAYTGGSDDETKELLKALLKEIQALRADIQKGPPAGGSPGDGPPVPPLKALDAVGVLKNRCAGCHTTAVAEEKGGGFELFTDKGETIRQAPASRRELVKRVTAGTMPPPGKTGGPLTAAERDAIRAAMTDIPAGKK